MRQPNVWARTGGLHADSRRVGGGSSFKVEKPLSGVKRRWRSLRRRCRSRLLSNRGLIAELRRSTFGSEQRTTMLPLAATDLCLEGASGLAVGQDRGCLKMEESL